MMAINHAATGAVIGLALSGEPALALPLAFLSHFALDVIPHWDPDGDTDEKRSNSKNFLYTQLILGAVLCFLLVLGLAVARPHGWIVAAIGAFLGASPDLLSIPRFISVKLGGKDIKNSWWFWRFHSRIQWKTGPKLMSVELIWLPTMIVFLVILSHR